MSGTKKRKGNLGTKKCKKMGGTKNERKWEGVKKERKWGEQRKINKENGRKNEREKTTRYRPMLLCVSTPPLPLPLTQQENEFLVKSKKRTHARSCTVGRAWSVHTQSSVRRQLHALIGRHPTPLRDPSGAAEDDDPN